jgi:hypothetical protein
MEIINMAEEPKSNLPESHEDLTYTSDWHGAPDAVLAEMADFADGAKAGVGVTLVIPGGVLSGTIESAQEFFARIAEPFRGRRRRGRRRQD